MRALLSVILVLPLFLTACGGGGGGAGGVLPTTTVTTTPSTVESSPVPEGESDGCLVAATKWADRMTSHVLDAVTTAPALAETLGLENLDDPSSEVTALCSDALAQPILKANTKMAEANFELSLCAFSGSCDPAQTRKIRRLADETASLVGDVRNRL